MSRTDKDIRRQRKQENEEKYEKAKFEFHLFFNWIVNNAPSYKNYICFVKSQGVSGRHQTVIEFYKGQDQIKVTPHEMDSFIDNAKKIFLPETEGQVVFIELDNHELDNIINIHSISAWGVKDKSTHPLTLEEWKSHNQEGRTEEEFYSVPSEYTEDERALSLKEVNPEIYESNMKTSSLLALLVSKLPLGQSQVVVDIVNNDSVVSRSLNIQKIQSGVSVDDNFEEFNAYLAYGIASGLYCVIYVITENDSFLNGYMWTGEKWRFTAVKDSDVLESAQKDIKKKTHKEVVFSTLDDIELNEED